MGRLIGIDYGLKRVGLAMTDPLQIIASPHETISSSEILDYLKALVRDEDVEAFVLGWPLNLQGEVTDSTASVQKFEEKLKKIFPSLPVHRQDERFTSKMAVQSMVQGGMKKKDRRDKSNIDKISASIILQSYLESKQL